MPDGGAHSRAANVKTTVKILPAVVLFSTRVMAAEPRCEAPGWEQQMLAGNAALSAGRYSEAERIYSAAGALCVGEPAGSRLALSLGQLGIARMSLGRHDGAAALLGRAVSILESLPDPPREELAEMLQALGSAFFYQHLYSNAEHAYQRSLELRIKVASPDGQAIISLLSNLGAVYQIERRYSEARASLERALEWLDTNAHCYPVSRAALMTTLGNLYQAEKRYDDAERSYRAAGEFLARSHQADSPLSATILNDLAVERMHRERYAEAAALFAEAVATIERGAQLAREDVARLLDNYRLCLRKQGNRTEVKRLDSRAKSILSLAEAGLRQANSVDVSQLGRRR